MPMETSGPPLIWKASELGENNTCGLMRSYDGSAYMAFVGKPPCGVSGNGSIPCMHLSGRPEVDGEGGKIIFHIGSFEELKEELVYPDLKRFQ